MSTGYGRFLQPPSKPAAGTHIDDEAGVITPPALDSSTPAGGSNSDLGSSSFAPVPPPVDSGYDDVDPDLQPPLPAAADDVVAEQPILIADDPAPAEDLEQNPPPAPPAVPASAAAISNPAEHGLHEAATPDSEALTRENDTSHHQGEDELVVVEPARVPEKPDEAATEPVYRSRLDENPPPPIADAVTSGNDTSPEEPRTSSAAQANLGFLDRPIAPAGLGATSTASTGHSDAVTSTDDTSQLMKPVVSPDYVDKVASAADRLSAAVPQEAVGVQRPKDDAAAAFMPESRFERVRALFTARETSTTPSLQEQLERRDQLARINTPVAGPCYRVAVLSSGAAVGKTTITAALGAILSRGRRDRIGAVDADPHTPSLAWRATASAPRASVRTVAQYADRIRSADEYLSACLTTDTNLHVLAGEHGLTAAEYQVADQVQAQIQTVQLVDTGPSMPPELASAILDTASAVVIVVSAGEAGRDGAGHSMFTPASSKPVKAAIESTENLLNWFAQYRSEALAARAVIAVSALHPGKGSRSAAEAIAERFSGRAVPIPFDQHLAENIVIDLQRLALPTMMALEKLAATVAADFARPQTQHHPWEGSIR